MKHAKLKVPMSKPRSERAMEREKRKGLAVELTTLAEQRQRQTAGQFCEGVSSDFSNGKGGAAML